MKRMSRTSCDETVNNVDVKPELSTDKRKITWIIHITVICYAMFHWQQLGVLPYLTRKLGVDAKMYGYLQSVFSFVQLCGGPLFGRFGDLAGGKYALILAYFACFSSYGILAIATTIPVLFLSRLPSCAMHGMQGSQMIITDVTTNEERAGGIGRLGIFYGIGMVIGPLLGGFVTDRFNEQAAAALSALGSVFCIFLIFFLIPADTKTYNTNEQAKDPDKQTGSVFDFKKYAGIFKTKNFTYLFMLKIISGMPFGIFQALFSLSSMEYFQLKARENGMLLSYVGIMTMLVQGFAVDFLTRRYSDAVLIKYSILTITSSYLLLIFVTNIYMFLVVLLPLVFGGSVFSIIITSIITKTVSGDDTGAALGLSMATHSFIRTISPTIGGILYASIGFPVLGIFGFIVNGALSIYLFMYGRQNL